jgi:hypothetical protein
LSDLTAIQNVFDRNMEAVWGLYGDTSSTYRGADVLDINSSTSLSLFHGALTPVAGTMGFPMGAQVAILISSSVGARYRGGHPRTYLPYVGQSVMFSGDTLLTAHLTAIQGAWTTTIANMAAGSITVSGVTYTCQTQQFGAILGKPRTGHVTVPRFATVGSSLVNDRVATQRRRLRKVERH